MAPSSNNADALRHIRNFLHEYSREDSEAALDLVYKVIGRIIDDDDDPENQRLFDFLESLEEVIPALYQVDFGRATFIPNNPN